MYVITSVDRGIYIKLDAHGKAQTCGAQEAQKFTKEKAGNVLASLPKTLRKFNFAITGSEESEEQKVVIHKDYEVSNKVLQWADRVKSCNTLAHDAQKRKEELLLELSKADKELSNILHTIEIENWKNGCDGYKIYKASKEVLEKRRPIKDELLVVRAILDMNISNLSEERIFQIIEGLKNRKFEYRDVDL